MICIDPHGWGLTYFWSYSHLGSWQHQRIPRLIPLMLWMIWRDYQSLMVRAYAFGHIQNLGLVHRFVLLEMYTYPILYSSFYGFLCHVFLSMVFIRFQILIPLWPRGIARLNALRIVVGSSRIVSGTRKQGLQPVAPRVFRLDFRVYPPAERGSIASGSGPTWGADSITLLADIVSIVKYSELEGTRAEDRGPAPFCMGGDDTLVPLTYAIEGEEVSFWLLTYLTMLYQFVSSHHHYGYCEHKRQHSTSNSQGRI